MSARATWMGRIAEIARFVVVGSVNTAIGLSVIFGLRYGLDVPDVPANIVGFLVAIVVSFLLNRRFTFRHDGPLGGAVVRFVLSFGVAYASNLAALLVLLRVFALPSYLAHPGAMVVYTGVFYLMAKFFAFRDR